MITYLRSIWSARYFWLHLALADIRHKYRRSYFGLLWAFIQPLALTGLFAFVMSHIFHAPIHDYALFIYSGLIFWEFIISIAMGGCNAFVNAEGYIKQFNHPLLIYSLRCVLASFINLLCAFSVLVIWSFIQSPQYIGFACFSLLLSFPVLFFFAWALSSLMAFIGVKFRDLSQLLILILQAVYFVSPILFLPRLFSENGLSSLLMYNPFYYLLNLFRLPLLDGKFPLLIDYEFLLGVSLCIWFYVWYLIKRDEEKLIFYL